MNDDQNTPAGKQYPIVGRIDGINLGKYAVEIQGRKVIDYDKIKREDPLLYKTIIENENKPDPYNDATTTS